MYRCSQCHCYCQYRWKNRCWHCGSLTASRFALEIVTETYGFAFEPAALLRLPTNLTMIDEWKSSRFHVGAHLPSSRRRKCYVRKDDGGLQPCSSFEVDLELALEGNPLGHQYYFVAHYRPQP